MKMTNLLLVSLCLLLSGSLSCVASRSLLDEDPALAFLDEAASEGPLLESFSIAGKSELLPHISVFTSTVQPLREDATFTVRLASRLQPMKLQNVVLGSDRSCHSPLLYTPVQYHHVLHTCLGKTLSCEARHLKLSLWQCAGRLHGFALEVSLWPPCMQISLVPSAHCSPEVLSL